MAVLALKPRREYSFTGHAVANPGSPAPGDRLDGEVDRALAAIGQLVDFVSVSLGSDGSVRPGVVGKTQLVPGLFDDVAADAAARLNTLVEAAAAASAGAAAAAAEANAAALAATRQNIRAEEAAAASGAGLASVAREAASAASAAAGAADAASRAAKAASRAEEAASRDAAGRDEAAAAVAAAGGTARRLAGESQARAAASAAAAEVSARAVASVAAVLRDLLGQAAAGADPQAVADLRDAAADALDAATSAAEAAASAAAAANSANHADGVEAVVINYGLLTQAWAEHMPDTIPPNILAVMDVTGDHWSSRWWANQAAQIVTGGLDELAAYVVTPASGDTVILPDVRTVYVDNSTVLAALTIRLPVVLSDVKTVQIGFRNSITLLAVQTSAGAAIDGAPVNAYGPGSAIQMRFDTFGWVYWK